VRVTSEKYKYQRGKGRNKSREKNDFPGNFETQKNIPKNTKKGGELQDIPEKAWKKRLDAKEKGER